MLRTINGVDFLLAFIITVLIVYIAMLRQTEHDLNKAKRLLSQDLLQAELILEHLDNVQDKLWERIFELRDEVADRDKLIRELRNCYNPYDKCTIWECNCL